MLLLDGKAEALWIIYTQRSLDAGPRTVPLVELRKRNLDPLSRKKKDRTFVIQTNDQGSRCQEI